jgi:hypothetical protein
MLVSPTRSPSPAARRSRSPTPSGRLSPIPRPSEHEVYGLKLKPLGDGYIPLEAVCIVKALDGDGDPTLVVRHAGNLNDWERVGMLAAALDIAKEQTAASWRGDPDEEDDDA